jgi:GMC oxidoreductase
MPNFFIRAWRVLATRAVGSHLNIGSGVRQALRSLPSRWHKWPARSASADTLPLTASTTSSPNLAASPKPPISPLGFFGGIVRPKNRGHIRLTGPNPLDPIQIESNMLSHPDDLKAAIACVELCREIGNSAVLRSFAKREVMPGDLRLCPMDARAFDYVGSNIGPTSSTPEHNAHTGTPHTRLVIIPIAKLMLTAAVMMSRLVTTLRLRIPSATKRLSVSKAGRVLQPESGV